MFYTGKVTNRKNGMPIAGVLVSDGKHIAKTAQDGSYQLEGWARSNVVHVGLLTEKHDDWFQYTGGKSGIYNFEITPSDTANSKFCFFQTSDTEIANRLDNPWVEYYAKKAEEHHPAFVIHTGDLCYKDGLCRHYSLMSNEKMGCPVRYVIGNHDYCAGAYGEQLFEMIYGPTWCSFDFGNIHFVILSIGKGDKPSGYEPRDQFEWLRHDLEIMGKNKKLIVFDHDCCYDEYSFIHKVENAYMEFDDKQLIAWIYGHYHHSCDILQKKVHLICTPTPDFGGIDSSPAGMRKISVIEDKVTSEMMYYGHGTEKCSESVWRIRLAGRGGFCSPVLYEGDIICATMDEGSPKNCGIYRLCGKTGLVKWSFQTENEIKNNFAIDGGRVYAQDCAARLYCINAEDGKLLWDVRSKLFGALETNMAVCVMAGLVFAGKQKQLYAYDKENGKLVWYRETLSGGGTPARFVKNEENGTLIVNPQWAKMMAIDPKTGTVQWENGERVVWFRTNTPLLEDGTLYTAGEHEYAAIDAVTGEILKRVCKDFCMDASGAAISDGKFIYVPTGDAGVVALDKNTLETVRMFPTGSAAVFTSPYIFGKVQTVEGSPVIKGDRLIFTANDGRLWIYNKNTAELIHSINIGAPSLVSPIVTEKHVYVADFDGCVTKFEY